MKLDPKGIEAAREEAWGEPIDCYRVSAETMEAAILEYLKATDSVIVPRDPTEDAVKTIKDWPHSYVHGPRSFYRAMIKAAEGK